MIIRNDIITEANLVEKSFIGNRLALDTYNPDSYPGTGDKWYDLSGNNNTITLYGAPSFSENAIYFNGVDQWGQRTSTPSLNIEGPKISAEFWVKMDTFVGFAALLSKVPYTGGPANEDGNYMFWYEGEGFKFTSNGLLGRNRLYIAGSPVYDQWIQLAVTYDNPFCYLYINGSKVGRIPREGDQTEYGYFDLGRTNNDLYIGRRGDAAPFINGHMSVINLFDYALTEDQVLRNYNYYSNRYNS